MANKVSHNILFNAKGDIIITFRNDYETFIMFNNVRESLQMLINFKNVQ